MFILRKGVRENEKMWAKSVKVALDTEQGERALVNRNKNVDINNLKSRVHVGVVTYIVIY